MPRPRTHTDEQILGAVRELLLESGPRGVTTAAVSQRSGAPTGTLYHRFGSRSNMVAQLWVRTVQRLQAYLVDAAQAESDPMEQAVAMALGMIDFCSRNPEDARLLTLASKERLERDPELPSDSREALASLNTPAQRQLTSVTRNLYGTASKAKLRQVTFAVVSIPYVAVRQCLGEGTDPALVRHMVETAVRAVLTADPARTHSSATRPDVKAPAGSG